MFSTDTETPAQTTMFAAAPQSEVTAMFNAYGSLEITFKAALSNEDVKQYSYGIVAAVRMVARAEKHTAPSGDTLMLIVLKPNAAKYAFEIRGKAKAYTEVYLARRAEHTATQQVSMF
jgi:hypothetical protein